MIAHPLRSDTSSAWVAFWESWIWNLCSMQKIQSWVSTARYQIQSVASIHTETGLLYIRLGTELDISSAIVWPSSPSPELINLLDSPVEEVCVWFETSKSRSNWNAITHMHTVALRKKAVCRILIRDCHHQTCLENMRVTRTWLDIGVFGRNSGASSRFACCMMWSDVCDDPSLVNSSFWKGISAKNKYI